MQRRITAIAGTVGVFAATFAFAIVTPAAGALPQAPWDPYFATPATVADLGSNAKTYGVAAGDFNKDGNPDVVVGRSTGNVTGLNWAAPAVAYNGAYNSDTNGRTFGVATGDFDKNGTTDMVVGRYDGRTAFVPGNGDGTFGSGTLFGWKQTTWNASAFVAMDANGDGNLDLVWGSNTATSGCSVTGQTQTSCPTAGGTWETVSDGDVRAFLGNGDGTFRTDHNYYVSGVLHNAGVLLAHPGTADAGSLAVADVDRDSDPDVVVGVVDGTNSTVRIVRNNGGMSFSVDAPFISQPTATTTLTAPIYYPAISLQNSPWGLAFADLDGDGNQDLLVGDRALYVYRFMNNGSGTFSLLPANIIVNRGNALLQHDSFRAAVGYTPSLAAADINRDGRPDVVMGLQGGAQTPPVPPATGLAHDGEILVDVSSGLNGYLPATVIGDIGMVARGVNVLDLNPPTNPADGLLDVVAGGYDGKVSTIMQTAPAAPDPNVYFAAGTGGGGFAAPSPMPWLLEAGNAASLAAADVNHDGNLDLVWSATTEGVAGGSVQVNNGDVRVLYGNGDGTFATNSYTRSGAIYAKGALLARIGPNGSAASSIAVGDVTGDGWPDVVVGGLDSTGANTVIQLIRNNADGTFTLDGSSIVSETTGTAMQEPVYWPAIAPASTPWGLALGDANGDGTLDLFVGDRAQYIYRFDNDGTGTFALHVPNSPPISTRPNIAFALTASPDSGFTPSLSAADFNGDGKADVALGLYSAASNYGGAKTNDGGIYLALSNATSSYDNSGLLVDIGTQARELTAVDLNGDGVQDLLSGSYDGKVVALRQLMPKDTDGDGISDYVDNAPNDANAPRVDMNSDGSINRADQLDNDFDTVLGNAEDTSTWQRLGDAADPDDDNDGVLDGSDDCPFTANADQANRDGDARGDACDPLDNRDPDGDGIPNSIRPGDPLFPYAQAAAAKWASASQHFVIRIDALGRWWQSEFTETLADAAMAPDQATFESQCANNYATGHTGLSGAACTGLPGGKNLPVTMATIPKMLWTDPAVVNWINARNDSLNLEIAQHGTYHVDNNLNGDWATLTDRNWIACETCGLTHDENLELLKVGQDTLLGNYGNGWIAQSGAAAGSPKIDWSGSSLPLVSYIAPYDASDTTSRAAMADLGYRGFSSSTAEESGSLAQFTSPEGSHMYAFDQFGMFHASAFKQVSPSDVNNLQQVVNNEGGNLHVWLIEEVDWSGRSDPATVDDTIDTAKFAEWNKLLDFVKAYPDSVAMTMGEVALAKAYDNAPTVANANQADSDHDGAGDVIDGATLTVPTATLARNVSGTLSATLANGGGQPITGQTVTFGADTDNNGAAETYTGTTNSAGVATVPVTPTAPVGSMSVSASWDNGLGTTVTGTGTANLADATHVTLASGNTYSGVATDNVTVSATLTDSDMAALAGRTLSFSIGSASATASTDTNGLATATLTLAGPAGTQTLKAEFAAAGAYAASSTTHTFTVSKETTVITQVLPVTPAAKGGGGGGGSAGAWTNVTFRLADNDTTPTGGNSLAGKTITLTYLPKNARPSVLGTATTAADGTVTFRVNKSGSMKADFAGDATYSLSTLTVTVG